MRRLVAIGFVWLGCTLAWVILGSTLLARSGETSSELLREVELLWGPAMEQRSPVAFYIEPTTTRETVTTRDAEGRPMVQQVERTVDREVTIPLDASDVKARLAMEQRQKGLLWFPTYVVELGARYTFRNDTALPRNVSFRFPLIAENAVYDGFAVASADEGQSQEPVTAAIGSGVASWSALLAPGEKRSFTVQYRSRGTGAWTYRMTPGATAAEVRDFSLALATDFAAVDFPAGTLSPTHHLVEGNAWHGEWKFTSLVANQPIGVSLPQKLNPGPLASKITFFAPVGLLFFFFVVAVFAASQKKALHAMHYFLFGCAFFAFHLLFAYLVDHLAVMPAFVVASSVSVLLVVTYARLFVGWNFALGPMAGSQIVYLVLFSYTFFWTGFTGLAIACGAVLTLFLVMQRTGRIDWELTTRDRQVLDGKTA